MLCGCFGAILPGKAALAGTGKVLVICTRGDKGHKGILGCPAQPKLASRPCPRTTRHSPPPQQAPWMSAVSRTHPHRGPIQSGSPGHPPGRAEVSINMAPAVLSSTAGRGGQEAQQFQNLPPLCASLTLGNRHGCSPDLTAARGVILLSAPFTGEKTEAWGEEVTIQGHPAKK